MFATFDAAGHLLAEPWPRLEERAPEKWAELLRSLAAPAAPDHPPEEVKTPPPERYDWAEGVTATALPHASAASLVDSERVKAEQLGPGDGAAAGQLVEVVRRDQDGTVRVEAVLLALPEGAWVLGHFKEL